MSEVSIELRDKLCMRAKQYYSDTMLYHNWHHAQDVVDNVRMLVNYSNSPEIIGEGNLLCIAAAWHDADYHVKDLADFATKEERSAALANTKLPELSEEQRALVVGCILDTTVSIKPKSSVFGEVLHIADVGYFAAPIEHFMDRLVYMWQEWGRPDWANAVERTTAFGKEVIDESLALMPQVMPKEKAGAWVEGIRRNLNHLQTIKSAPIEL